MKQHILQSPISYYIQLFLSVTGFSLYAFFAYPLKESSYLFAVKLQPTFTFFVVCATCVHLVHWIIPHCLSSFSTALRCCILQSVYITIINTSLRDFYQKNCLFECLKLYILITLPVFTLKAIYKINAFAEICDLPIAIRFS